MSAVSVPDGPWVWENFMISVQDVGPNQYGSFLQMYGVDFTRVFFFFGKNLTSLVTTNRAVNVALP